MNMSYCRMRNTAIDLEDCYENWNETQDWEELEARKRILELAKEIIRDYGDNED